jgi:hypothetical protein
MEDSIIEKREVLCSAESTKTELERKIKSDFEMKNRNGISEDTFRNLVVNWENQLRGTRTAIDAIKDELNKASLPLSEIVSDQPVNMGDLWPKISFSVRQLLVEAHVLSIKVSQNGLVTMGFIE